MVDTGYLEHRDVNGASDMASAQTMAEIRVILPSGEGSRVNHGGAWLVLGWLGAADLHVEKICQALSSALGSASARITAPKHVILSMDPRTQRAFVASVVMQMYMHTELREFGTRHGVWLMSFSNGGTYMFQRLVELLVEPQLVLGCGLLEERSHEDNDDRTKFGAQLLSKWEAAATWFKSNWAGVVFDSSPCNTKNNTHATSRALIESTPWLKSSFGSGALAEHAIESILYVWWSAQRACVPADQASRHEFHDFMECARTGAELYLGELYLFSTCDHVCDHEWVKQVARARSACGTRAGKQRITMQTDFESSPHCTHYKMFPNRYIEQVGEFIQNVRARVQPSLSITPAQPIAKL
ncbi:hypothetical protein FVE85_7917 [Porphyridium purpureum]|uniref:Transmembrane protein 53 n=1 Tax=Porphyridium purpureum TaxID=35688 RepID=A0A5J4YN67_PORPP|nr:hypothetical protein FVE85_7917 [Porphyridium purpureum]|eukprot:POR4790..scf295_9